MKDTFLRRLSYLGLFLLLFLSACKPTTEKNNEDDGIELSYITTKDSVEPPTSPFQCETLISSGQFKEALSVCLDKAKAGDVSAQTRLGSLYISGQLGKEDWEQGTYWLIKAAEQNDPQSQYMVGECYLLGRGLQKDEVLAVNWLLKAAKANVTAAQTLLGECYLNGNGVEQNTSRGVQWFTMSAQQGDPLALYRLGMLYLKGIGVNHNVYLAIRYLSHAAQKNVALAQLEMAKLYHEGKLVSKDETAAFKWYQAAAAQEEVQSLYVVGLSLIQGTFAQKQNIDEGAEYLKRAANKGYYPAQYALASLFIEGYPVLKDNFVAIEYLRKAALNGSQDAQVKLAKVLIDFAIPQYDQVAFYWVLQAAKSQHIEGQYLLGQCYQDGIGTEVDYDSAIQIFTRLAEQNYPLAQLRLGQMYYKGQGIEKDLQSAKKWLLKAATSEVPQAKHWLTLLFREGVNLVDEQDNQEEINRWIQYSVQMGEPEGIYLKGISHLYGKNNFEQNIEYGLELIEKAALNEYVLAQRELGMIYEQGLFNLSNLDKAHEWYLKASQNGDDVAQFQLANMYYKGSGVPKSYIESYAWANLASLAGKEDATLLKNEISQLLDSTELAKAREMANKYFSTYKKR